MPERKTLQLPNITISYLEWKPENASADTPRLLLLHGLADNATVWTSLGDDLGNQYHIVAPDLRGHGESGKPETGYFFKDTMGDLEALMADLNWKNAHVLGHSWAGKLAAIWAKERPEIFCSMILVDPIFIIKMPAIMKLTLPILYRKLECLKCMGPFASLGDAEAVARGLGEYAGWSSLQELVFYSNMEQKPNGSWGSKFVKPARNEMFEEVMRVPGLTVPIDIPSLLVLADKGVNRFEWQIQPYKRFLTNLMIEKVAGNHWAFLVEPAGFNRAVSAFLLGIK